MTQHAPEVSPELFWDTMTAFQQSAALKAAVDLEIFTKIGERQSTAAEIAPPPVPPNAACEYFATR